jgi:ACS family allantoate permease-like MFS transporter
MIQLTQRRFFYGFNVVVTPLFVIISAMWWKTSEQPLRIGIWIAGASIGSIIGQAIDFGAVNIGGEYENHPWKWIYVILGSVSIGVGLFYFLVFPDSPMKARFLTEREKQIAVLRVQANNTGMQSRRFKLKQVAEAFMDPQLYIIALFGFCFSFANAALGRYVSNLYRYGDSLLFDNFGGLLVTSFGYEPKKALELTMLASGVAVFSMIFSG